MTPFRTSPASPAFSPCVLRSLLVGALVGLAGSPVEADHLVIQKRAFPAAKVLSLTDGRLHFRTSEGATQSVRLDELDLLIVDREGAFADFNQAERFLADGEPRQAVARYRRAQRLRDDFWAELISARLAIAADRAGMLTDAVQGFIRALRAAPIGPTGATFLLPGNLPNGWDAESARAVEQLDGALALNPPELERIPLEFLRYEILRHAGSSRARAVVGPVARVAIPPACASPRMFRIQLSALDESFAQGADAELLASVDRAIRDAPPSLVAGFLLIKGKSLLAQAATRQDVIRATWPLLRIVIHLHDDAAAPEAMVQTGIALDRLHRADKARESYTEAIAHPKITDEIRRLAEERLRRIESAGPK